MKITASVTQCSDKNRPYIEDTTAGFFCRWGGQIVAMGEEDGIFLNPNKDSGDAFFLAIENASIVTIPGWSIALEKKSVGSLTLVLRNLASKEPSFTLQVMWK